jgi:hypothetical protein
MKQDLLTKNGIAAGQLAREFLSLKADDKIQTIGEYAELFDLGRGTIQTALKYLEDNGAIILDARGHLGTYIVKLDYKILWNLAGYNNISGVMPLPYSRRYEGLATGLYKVFEEENIPFNMAYLKGSERRIQALQSGKYDFAIMSMLAAKHNIESGKSIKIIVDFGPQTNVSSHCLIFADIDKYQIEDGMKVAIDPTSIDHSILTSFECQFKKVDYVELPYNQIISNLVNKKLDAAIWNFDEIQDHNLSLKSQPLQSQQSIRVNQENTHAVLVVTKNNGVMEKILGRIVNKEKVCIIQSRVLEGKILPEY